MLKVDPRARRKGEGSRLRQGLSSRAQRALPSPADTTITSSRAIHHLLPTTGPAPGLGLGRRPSLQKWKDWGLPSGLSKVAQTTARPEKLHQGVGQEDQILGERRNMGGNSQEP